MLHPTPDILALDFDGVVCDGLIEYFQTAWRAYCELFKPEDPKPPEGLAEQFYPLRPVVETGWEMPILLHALLLGTGSEAILTDWAILAPQLTLKAGLEQSQAAAAVDGVRDRWIQADLSHWLAQHRFYPGVIDRIQLAMEHVEVFIISTKEGRFIRQLLEEAGVAIDSEHILGKEVKQPKYESLRQLQSQYSPHIWFVEDRLKALIAVEQQTDLQGVGLFLADWGYNTAGDRQQAESHSQIRLLSLQSFNAPFTAWPTKTFGMAK